MVKEFNKAFLKLVIQCPVSEAAELPNNSTTYFVKTSRYNVALELPKVMSDVLFQSNASRHSIDIHTNETIRGFSLEVEGTIINL